MTHLASSHAGLVFVLQVVLIAMIIAAQFEQDERTGSFPDVPYDVTISTRIGQVAGMMIILFYQKDFWIASTLQARRETSRYFYQTLFVFYRPWE